MHALTHIIGHRQGIAVRILIAEVLFLALCWFGTVDFVGRYAGADLAQYRTMAQAAPGLASGIPAPFAYRIAVPWMVGTIFPTDDVTGFVVFRLLLVIALVMQFFRVLKLYGASEPVALVLASIALWNPYLGGFLLYNPFQAGDTLAYVLMLCALEGYRRHSLVVFGCALFAAAFVRETPLLIIPALLFMPRADRTRLRGLLLSALPALMAFILIRRLIDVPNTSWSLFSTLVSYLPESVSLERWGRMLLNAFAPLSLLVILLLRRESAVIRTYAVECALGVGILLASFLGGDVERLVSPVLFLLLLVLRPTLERCFNDSAFTYALTVGVIVCSLHFLFARYPLIPKVPYYAGAAVSCVLVLWTGRKAGHTEEPP
ncbi:MAG: hypothetical protein ACKO9V_02305 [Candidatus Kapaibacterium sp.]